MADIPNFDEFKKQQGASVPSFEDFQKQRGTTAKPIGEQPISFGGMVQTLKQPFQKMGAGAKEFTQGALGQEGHSKSRGINQALEGFGTIAKPLALGAALPAAVAAPIPALIGLGTGALGSMAGGALANKASEQMELDPETAKLAETGGEFAGGLAGGGLGALGGRKLGLSSASGLANSALGTTRKTRAFGTNPGRAALEETSGIMPESVQSSASKRIGELTPVMERHVELGQPIDLTAARRAVQAGLAKSTRQGTPTIQRQLEPMAESLRGNPVTGTPYPNVVPAREGLDILRGFNEEHTRFVPERTTQANQVAKQAGGTLRNSIRAAAPGSEELNTRISNLIPARDLALKAQTDPGMVETGVHRMTRPTGGLMPAIAGLMEGGPGGALAVMGAQEALSQPSVKMALARALFRGSAGQRLGVPAMPQGPLNAPLGYTPPPRALLGPGAIRMPSVPDTSGPTGVQPTVNRGVGLTSGNRTLAPPSQAPQGGFATGTTNELVPVKHPVTGKIEYVPKWTLQKGSE